MPALTKSSMFDYLAHVAREDGTVIELSGTTEQPNQQFVYQWLQTRATELGGFLVSQNISESDDDLPWSDTVGQEPVKSLPAPEPVKDRPTAPTIFGDGAVFGEYKDTYRGASLVTYKVTKE